MEVRRQNGGKEKQERSARAAGSPTWRGNEWGTNNAGSSTAVDGGKKEELSL